MIINIDTNNFAQSTVDQGKLAVVTSEMFGGINVNLATNSMTAFDQSARYMGLNLLRWPGGTLAENGSVTVDSNGAVTLAVNGANQSLWLDSAPSTESNYLYDLSYPELIHPLALGNESGRSSFTDFIKLANDLDAAVEIFIPLERYSDVEGILTNSVQEQLTLRLGADLQNFLKNLFVDRVYGQVPETIILDVGNEGLVWTTKFEGQSLAAGQKYDAAAVESGIRNYFTLLKTTIKTALEFQNDNPSADFKIAIQLPFMNNQAEFTDDPQDVFLRYLSDIPNHYLAEIDVIRFHGLDMGMDKAANFENWFSDELRAVKLVIDTARHDQGIESNAEISVSAWSTDGTDSVADARDPGFSLKAAAASIAAIASFAEMGVDFAAAWGVGVPHSGDVQASRYDAALGRMVYTPRGEVLRQMSESLPGTTLIFDRNFTDSGRTQAVNMQAFADDSKVVIFVSANDISDSNGEVIGSFGELVTLNLSDLGSDIGYVWIETISVADKVSGEAIIWNPLVDSTSEQERGEALVSFTKSSITFRLNHDYEIARVIVARTDPGASSLDLIGDSRKGSGIVSDELTGGRGDDKLNGLTGNDTIDGGAGSDWIDGGDGNDWIAGGIGDDTILGGNQYDTIYGGAGNDLVDGGNGRDQVWLGDGNDVFNDNAQNDSHGRDTVYGMAGNDTINGGGGNDFFDGGDGNDWIAGGIGDDTILGGNQHDTIYGGAGNDLVDGGNGRDQVWLGDGNDVFNDNAQNDSNGRDTVYGMAGNDTINGGGGNDFFDGGDGNDWIAGGIGDDTILGGGGNDELIGGAGADSFVFLAGDGQDRVTDFVDDIDTLVLDDALWDGALTAGQVVATFSSVHGSDTVFDFGGGNVLTIAGITDTAIFIDDIAFV